MSDQTYAQALTRPQNASGNLTVTEPDQITGMPTSATEVKKATQLTAELGGTGTTIVGGFLTGQDYNPDFTGTRRIKLFDEMRLSDATVRAGLNMVKLPILSADWYIKGNHEESREFIEKQLLNNPGFSWTGFLRQALTMCDNGNSIFEKVFQTTPEGKIGWKRLSPRMSKTIHKWTIKGEGGKEVPGIYQILPTGQTAEIPRWKLLYFINEQEGSNYEGISLLRAVYQPYYYKQLYYKVDAIAVEKQGMGIVKVTHPPNANPQEIAKVEEIAKNVRANERAYVKLPAGYNLEFIDTHADSLKDTKEMIDHHDRQISKAFLAQFIELGTKSSGSYALSSDQSKMFTLGLEYITKIVQEEMNNRAIKELVDLNFSGIKEEDYPTLEYGAIGDVDYLGLSEALTKLSGSGLITPNAEMEKYILNTMKVPVVDDLDEQWEEKKERAEQMALNPPMPTDDEGKPLNDKKAKLPNKSMKPPKAKPVPKKEEGEEEPEDIKRKDIQATELMQDMMEFSESLAKDIQKEIAKRKEEHAPIT